MKDFINKIVEKLTEKRPIERLRNEYGRYTQRARFVEYSDKNKEYLNPVTTTTTKEVHSAKAFVDFIREELKRRNNLSGLFSTVQLGLTSGNFIADDNFQEGKCEYKRLKSEQLITLESYNNEILDQEELIKMLLRLKPSFNTYENVFMGNGTLLNTYYQNIFSIYSKLKISRNATMNTTPVYDAEGNADNSYTCTFKLMSGAKEGTEEDIIIPEGFKIACPFVKAGQYNCQFDVDVQPLFNSSGAITFKVKVPNYETEIEQAIINEAESLKEELKEFSELLILADL